VTEKEGFISICLVKIVIASIFKMANFFEHAKIGIDACFDLNGGDSITQH
jgi:hypothetical protein